MRSNEQPMDPGGAESARFTLTCDAERKAYSVSEKGQADRITFESVNEALAYIGTLIEVATPVCVSNEHGKVFMMADVSPGECG